MKTVYQIHVSAEEVDIILELIKALDNCPTELTNDGYVAIMESIAARDKDINIDGVELVFED